MYKSVRKKINSFLLSRFTTPSVKWILSFWGWATEILSFLNNYSFLPLQFLRHLSFYNWGSLTTTNNFYFVGKSFLQSSCRRMASSKRQLHSKKDNKTCRLFLDIKIAKTIIFFLGKHSEKRKQYHDFREIGKGKRTSTETANLDQIVFDTWFIIRQIIFGQSYCLTKYFHV